MSKKFLNFPLIFDILDQYCLWPSEKNNNSWCQRLGVHSVEAQLPACHQVGRQDQVNQPLWCRTCKLRKIQAITYVVILTITLLSAATIAFKELFFRNCQYCWRHLVGDGGNFVPNSGWTEKCTISKCIFSLSKSIDPQFFFITFSLKSWNNKN